MLDRALRSNRTHDAVKVMGCIYFCAACTCGQESLAGTGGVGGGW